MSTATSSERRDGQVVHGEFVASEFAPGFIGRCGWFIFHWRLPILVLGIAATLVLAFFAVMAILVLTGKGKKTKEIGNLPRKTLVFADLAEVSRHLVAAKE